MKKLEVQSEMLGRAVLLLGEDTMKRISQTRVIIFGVGGVGSWCAESLVRTGIRHLTIVDNDIVCETNRNRQLMATSRTVGRVKVEAMRERLLELNPEAEIEAKAMVYNKETAESFHLEDYDFVIDAIDSLQDKAHLILHATGIKKVTLFSSMGAALRVDPFMVRKAEFWKVKNDALARALRNRFKRDKTFPSRKFQCVYSEEAALPNLGLTNEACPDNKARVNGSLSHVTAIFGMSLAGMVIQQIKGMKEE